MRPTRNESFDRADSANEFQGGVQLLGPVLVEGGDIRGEYTTLVNPEAWIPGWITRLTGIEPQMVSDAPRFRDISARVRDALEGRVFVAHNVGFDWRFVAEELRMANSIIPEGPKLCTVRMARRVLPGLRRRGLDSLSRYYDVDIVNRHRAGDDARARVVPGPNGRARLVVDHLDALDARLAERRYLCGAVITEADWRLFATLVRFDTGYYGQFRCNRNRLVEFTHLWPYTRDLYQQPGVAETVDIDAVKGIYYGSRPPHIIPKGPELDFNEPHDREKLSAAIV